MPWRERRRREPIQGAPWRVCVFTNKQAYRPVLVLCFRAYWLYPILKVDFEVNKKGMGFEAGYDCPVPISRNAARQLRVVIYLKSQMAPSCGFHLRCALWALISAVWAFGP